MRQNDNVGDNLGTQLRQLVVSFLNFLVEGLVFDFQLFKINQMEPISQLLLLTQHLLLVLEPVAQSDVLKTVLMDFLVLGCVGILPLLDLLGRQFFAISAVDRILRHRPFQFFELVLNLLAFSLLLVKLGLKFTSHAVVAVLCVLQVEADLVHVG